MKITGQGLFIDNFRNASPSLGYCTFTDTDGGTFIIKTTVLVHMYELVKFDLKRRGLWHVVLDTLETETKS